MTYTIGQVAEIMGLTAHTLRFYDKEGLLPMVKRTRGGSRLFTDEDVDWLIILECLKSTGLQIKDIRHYIDLCQKGDKTLGERLALFEKQKKNVEEQIKTLETTLEKINFKIKYYKAALKDGSENIYERNKCLAKEKSRLFKKG